MELKIIKALLSKIVPKRPSLHMLRYGLFLDGTLYATNTDQSIEIDTGTDLNGFMDVALFLKTLDFEKSMLTEHTFSTEDFPLHSQQIAEQKYTEASVSSYLFDNPLKPFLSHCAKAGTPREVLGGVFFNSERDEIVATDGYSFLAEAARGSIDESFIIPGETISCIDSLPTVRICRVYKDSCTDQAEFLMLEGEEYCFYTKLFEGPYPDYPKVIPTKTEKLEISRQTVLEVVEACKTLLPFAPPKSKVVIFEGSEICVCNIELNKHLRIDLKNPLALPEYQEARWNSEESKTYYVTVSRIAFNADKLITFFSDILHYTGGDEFVLEYCTLNSQALICKTKENTFLIMPIKLLVGFHVGIEEIKPEYLTINPPKPKAAKKAKLNKKVEAAVLQLQEKYGAVELLKMIETLELV